MEKELKEIGRLQARKDTPFTREEVEGMTYNFLQRVFKKEAEKMENVKICPIVSSMSMMQGQIQGQIKPVGLQGTCLKERCGFWSVCPANPTSLLYDIAEAFLKSKMLEGGIPPLSGGFGNGA